MKGVLRGNKGDWGPLGVLRGPKGAFSKGGLGAHRDGETVHTLTTISILYATLEKNKQ